MIDLIITIGVLVVLIVAFAITLMMMIGLIILMVVIGAIDVIGVIVVIGLGRQAIIFLKNKLQLRKIKLYNLRFRMTLLKQALQ